MENCDFSWGFRVQEQRAEDDKSSPSKKQESSPEKSQEGSPEKKKEMSAEKKKEGATDGKDKKAAPTDKFKVKTEKFDKCILKDINFEMQKGDFLVVIG